MFWIIGILLLLTGCGENQTVSGYVEAIYLDYSAPVAGRLIYRPHYDGQTIISGDLIFALSENPEQEQLQSLEAKMEQATWVLKDLEKGLRIDDLAYLQANIDGAMADVRYWTQNLERLTTLSEESRYQDAIDQAKQSLEKARSSHSAASSKFKSGKLGERSDLILAKRAEIKSIKADINELQWYLAQKKRNINFSGRVKDIYYELGEWVSAYSTIMTIENVNERYVVFYLNQKQLSRVAMGDSVTVQSADKSQSLAKIVYISDHAEFTPPIVYSTTQSELYRFMVKAQLQTSRFLHPGQPVEIEL